MNTKEFYVIVFDYTHEEVVIYKRKFHYDEEFGSPDSEELDQYLYKALDYDGNIEYMVSEKLVIKHKYETR